MAGVLGDLIAGINSDDLDQQLRGTKGVRVFLSVGKRLMPSKHDQLKVSLQSAIIHNKLTQLFKLVLCLVWLSS
jgi:hypothetical protein